MEDAKWKKFEALVAKVQADLSPTAMVKLNQRIIGKISNIPRQIRFSKE
jgi:hypothetical protein